MTLEISELFTRELTRVNITSILYIADVSKGHLHLLWICQNVRQSYKSVSIFDTCMYHFSAWTLDHVVKGGVGFGFQGKDVDWHVKKIVCNYVIGGHFLINV